MTALCMPREKSQGKFVSGWNAQVKLWAEGQEAGEAAKPAQRGIWGHAKCNATE